MEIGLIDVDGHNFPNLALMKISSYHKSKGDPVEWWNGLKYYDVVYQAKVFDDTYSKDNEYIVMADKVIKGGTGYDTKNKLPDEIEHQHPDYDLYGVKGTAYGFLTRGCPRNCPFCIVTQKEGGVSTQVAEISEFWDGQKAIELLDPNLTACKDSEKLFDDLINTNAMINFNQGIDVRFITDKHCDQLNRMKIKAIHFAWDNYELQTYEKLKKVKPLLRYDYHRIMVYVLTNYNTTHSQDMERIIKIRELGFEPYVMVFDKHNAPKVTRKLQRWVNAKPLFKACEFDEYLRGCK